MSVKTLSGLIIAVVAVILLSGSTYTVQEGYRALVLRLGEIKTSSDGKPKIFGPGLHFKAPFVNTVKRFDVRLQTLDVESSRILTQEQKYVLVDYYAKWRIRNIPLYFTRTGGYEIRAQMLLKQKINDALRAAFGKRTIQEVVSDQRSKIMDILKEKASASAESLGIQVTDVRIMGIDLPKQVREAVYQRMRTEREQVATKLRSQGIAAAETIRARTDRNVSVLIEQEKTKAQKIRADGDLKAADIYTKAYSKNPKFYAFYRSLLAYQAVFNNKDTLMVLKPNSEFFKYFNSVGQQSKKNSE